jgi:multidrug efflux pump subunit AcrA (membrane-fusion protein)
MASLEGGFMRVHSIIPVLIGPMLLWAAGCSKEAGPAAGQQAAAPPPTPVVVATIGQADVPVVREYVARTEAITTVMIEARVEALLQTMEFE